MELPKLERGDLRALADGGHLGAGGVCVAVPFGVDCRRASLSVLIDVPARALVWLPQ